MKKTILLLFLSVKIFAQNIEYSNLKNWVAHPDIKDFSDSIPSPFINSKIDNRVDVFYIYPTIYDEDYEFKTWNAEISNVELLNEIISRPILFQASVFNVAGKVYSPLYRQAHLDIFNDEHKNIKDSVLYFAFADIKNAFEYYLKNWNNNRPIIIAGHSQGALLAKYLLKEYFDNKPLKNNLVAAYIIGTTMPDNFFDDLTPCKDSNQTNCFVGWRTYQNDFVPEFVKKENFKNIVTNPITWEIENNIFGDDKKHKGAILFDFNKLHPNLVDAKISGNILWISRPKIWWSWFYMSKNYHQGDINLFYADIRSNISNRINNYFQEK